MPSLNEGTTMKMKTKTHTGGEFPMSYPGSLVQMCEEIARIAPAEWQVTGGEFGLIVRNPPWKHKGWPHPSASWDTVACLEYLMVKEPKFRCCLDEDGIIAVFAADGGLVNCRHRESNCGTLARAALFGFYWHCEELARTDK